ncbi:hypothetical protein HAX54_014684, partial [Datura stramonium]|nr:hypothetical protein [Datura stramonium]
MAKRGRDRPRKVDTKWETSTKARNTVPITSITELEGRLWSSDPITPNNLPVGINLGSITSECIEITPNLVLVLILIRNFPQLRHCGLGSQPPSELL